RGTSRAPSAATIACRSSSRWRMARRRRASGLSTLIKDHLAGGASRRTALLLPQILPVFLVVAPCPAGAPLRDLVLLQRGQATSQLRSKNGGGSMPRARRYT